MHCERLNSSQVYSAPVVHTLMLWTCQPLTGANAARPSVQLMVTALKSYRYRCCSTLAGTAKQQSVPR
jgi:hypothetical protein